MNQKLRELLKKLIKEKKAKGTYTAKFHAILADIEKLLESTES